MSEYEVRIHNQRVDDRRAQEAREHGYESWAEYMNALQELREQRLY